MNKQMAPNASRVESWRTHCQSHSGRIRALADISPSLRPLERFEAELIRRLCQADLAIDERAVALRWLVELRHCTAREVGGFFQVPATVIVRGLSFVVTGAQVESLISTVIIAPARSRRRRNTAA